MASFDKADIDGSGDLEGDELKEVAAWVIKSFTPDGDTKPLDDAAINAEVAKLLRSADADNDGKTPEDFLSRMNSHIEARRADGHGLALPASHAFLTRDDGSLGHWHDQCRRALHDGVFA